MYGYRKDFVAVLKILIYLVINLELGCVESARDWIYMRGCIIKVGRNAVLSQMVVSAQSLHGACLLVSNMDSLCNYVASLT